jgi:hypothetical protein
MSTTQWIPAVGYLSAVLAAAGCGTAGVPPADRAFLHGSHPHSVVIAVSRSPSFNLASGGPVAWGRRAERLVKSTRVPDPAVSIRETLVEALADTLGLEIADPGARVTTVRTPPAIAHDYRGTDLVLDVRTNKWGLAPTSAGRYGLVYDGTLRLIDTRSRQVIAEGGCSSGPDDAGGAPSYQALLANQGALLKDELASLAAHCADDYRKRVLGI